ncbi:hypothetical protein SAMN06269185_2368 [Natronoarchaeum philippinense]|uniref:DUF7130 domain-containing protein n=1 Tax=Natronoarchaeum philippinense TaxID=558529 RepID=A0A285P5B7_NATPI|nr:hypothetical protein [Natronoarchaeum philippinense]SNZ15071.1 hypothetical protein SAMN06269185_2368 [Natronoarchaeum philippinense]
MARSEHADVSLGVPIYNDDGTKLGTVRGFDEDGFYVTLADDAVAEESEQLRSGGLAGERDLMWRCWQCGEVGRIAEIPDGCPSCGAPKEDIYYWTED